MWLFQIIGSFYKATGKKLLLAVGFSRSKAVNTRHMPGR